MAPRRVVICGVTGSGKSALAVRAAELLDLPHISSDEIYWLPGWRQRDPDDLRSRYGDVAAKPAWVIDSLPSAARAQLLERADLVVALDLGRWLTLRRLARRTLYRWWTREEIHNGNVESIRNMLGRNSILYWHFRSFSSWRRTIDSIANDRPTRALIVLRSPVEVEAWLSSLTNDPGAAAGACGGAERRDEGHPPTHERA